MHILHILDHSLPLHSGYSFRSQNIFKAQAKRGWQVTVLTSPRHQKSWKGKVKLYEEVKGFPHFRTPLSMPLSTNLCREIRLMLSLVHRIWEVAFTDGPDIIHAHSPVLNAIPAFWVGRRLKIPVIYEIRAFWEDAAVDHGSYKEDSWKYRLVRMLETWACRKASHVTVICDVLHRDLIDRGLPLDKLSIAPNGIDIEEFQKCTRNEEMLSKWNLEGKGIIGFFGSFYKYEGLDVLLEAFKLLSQKNRDCCLLLVGAGEMEDYLKERIRILGLSNRVAIPGRVPHERIPGIYALADILVYPRHSIRLTELVTPLKPLEAMAMGKTVIASDVGGHRELIVNGDTGLLFPAGNAAALASAMETMLLDKDRRLALAQKAKRWVSQKRSWAKTVDVYEDVYMKVLAKSAI